MAVALVTGGASGIGLAIVRRLAARGDRVFSASRDPYRATAIDGVTPLPLDLTDAAAASSAVGDVVAATGRLDVLINNAGTGVLASLEETTDDDARMIFETNVLGPLRLARAVLPVMREQGAGRIVNVTSMNDTLPAPFAAYYSASKAALASASFVLDAETRVFGVKVTVVAPGLFLTPMAEALATYSAPPGSPYEARFAAMIAQQPSRLPDAGDPDVVARAIEECLDAQDPPFRIVVGADAEAMDKIARDAGPERLAQIIREYVESLGQA